MTVALQQESLQQELDHLEAEFQYLSAEECPTTHGIEATLWAEEMSTNRLRASEIKHQLAAIPGGSTMTNVSQVSMPVPPLARDRTDTIHKLLVLFGFWPESPEIIQAIAALTRIGELHANPHFTGDGEKFWTERLPRIGQRRPVNKMPERLEEYIKECEQQIRDAENQVDDEDYA